MPGCVHVREVERTCVCVCPKSVRRRERVTLYVPLLAEQRERIVGPVKRAGTGRTDLDGNKAKTWAGSRQRQQQPCRPESFSLFFFRCLIIHTRVCASTSLPPSAESLRVCAALGGGHVYPARCLSCHRGSHASGQPADALGPASASHVKSGNKLITSERFYFLFQGFGTRKKKKKKKLGGHDEGYLKDLAGHVDFLETLD